MVITHRVSVDIKVVTKSMMSFYRLVVEDTLLSNPTFIKLYVMGRTLK